MSKGSAGRQRTDPAYNFSTLHSQLSILLTGRKEAWLHLDMILDQARLFYPFEAQPLLLKMGKTDLSSGLSCGMSSALFLALRSMEQSIRQAGAINGCDRSSVPCNHGTAQKRQCEFLIGSPSVQIEFSVGTDFLGTLKPFRVSVKKSRGAS